jgi:catechol-2,3-dioxygenase
VQVQALGHVVLKVRDLQLAEVFYSRTLGMRVVLRIEDPRMTFFTLETPGNHHDFALMEIDAVASTPADDATGLAHVALKIGSSAERAPPRTDCARNGENPSPLRGRAEVHAESSRPRSGRERDRAVRRRLRHLMPLRRSWARRQ